MFHWFQYFQALCAVFIGRFGIPGPLGTIQFFESLKRRSRIAGIFLFQKTCCDSLLASSGVRMIRISFFSAAVPILMSIWTMRTLKFLTAIQRQQLG